MLSLTMNLHSRRLKRGTGSVLFGHVYEPTTFSCIGYDELMWWSAFRIKSKLPNTEPKWSPRIHIPFQSHMSLFSLVPCPTRQSFCHRNDSAATLTFSQFFQYARLSLILETVTCCSPDSTYILYLGFS